MQLGLLAGVSLIAFLLITRAMQQREKRWESDEWRQSERGAVKVGNALLEIHSMLEPDRKHHLEEVRRARLEEEDSGDPPEPGAVANGEHREDPSG